MMFQGDAEAAISLYSSVFSDFTVIGVKKYEQDEGGKPDTIKEARVDFNGQKLIIIDSPVRHEFGFTPSISLFAEFDTAEALEHAFKRLSDGGEVMMPLDDYGFSPKFGWLADRFGVSWQLNLPNKG